MMLAKYGKLGSFWDILDMTVTDRKFCYEQMVKDLEESQSGNPGDYQ